MVNSIIIILAVLIWMFLGYKVYGSFISRRLGITDKNKTPAITHHEKGSVDFSPAKKPFLIGHHFASIAGAGPIIGPILAISYFGWLPIVLWVSLGSVLIGAMHDYTTLIASVRNKAKGMSSLAKEYLNDRAGWIFGLMIWITLILIITVFSVSAAESIIGAPSLVIPLITITIVAIILGMGVQKWKWNYKKATIIGTIIILASIVIGYEIPITISLANSTVVRNIWVTIIILYAGMASVLPVWFLLRPRDYLSSIQMGLVMLLGIIAIIITHPTMNAPALYNSGVFPLWPILFITVACGAISGFHGLVSSGTTSKQLSKESHGRAVGYGGMLGEGLLAIIVTIVVSAGLLWNPEGGVIGMAGTFQTTLKQGWIVLFGTGFGNIVGALGIPLITTGVAALLGAFMVNQFILTSVDTSTRLGRFVITEHLTPKIKNHYLAVIITLIPAWLLAITNSYEILWRLFGSSNQLIASISLITITAYFISKKKKAGFIAIPAIFILVTTLTGLTYLTFRSGGYLSNGNYVLAIISMLMFILGIVVAIEGIIKVFKHKKSINTKKISSQ